MAAWVIARRGRLTFPARADAGPLAGVTLFGGVVAPVALLLALRSAEAQHVSLVLNLEVVLTAAFAARFFGEAVGRRTWLAVALAAAGAAALTVDPRAGFRVEPALGLAAVAAAGWALDNNFSRRLAVRDAPTVAAWKGLAAGPPLLVVAALSGDPFPAGPARMGAAIALGALAFGASVALLVAALGSLGAARAVALFATWPVAAVALSWLALGERPGWEIAVAAPLLVAAVRLVLTERHDHFHVHERMEHDHLHVHDEHHRHAHRGDEGPEPHRHPHVHEPTAHAHPHAPDLHHSHPH